MRSPGQADMTEAGSLPVGGMAVHGCGGMLRAVRPAIAVMVHFCDHPGVGEAVARPVGISGPGGGISGAARGGAVAHVGAVMGYDHRGEAGRHRAMYDGVARVAGEKDGVLARWAGHLDCQSGLVPAIAVAFDQLNLADRNRG